jgi:hypothetical protein
VAWMTVYEDTLEKPGRPLGGERSLSYKDWTDPSQFPSIARLGPPHVSSGDRHCVAGRVRLALNHLVYDSYWLRNETPSREVHKVLLN